MKRADFLEAFYRIWEAGDKPEDKLALLDKVNGPVGGTDLSDLPIGDQLQIREEFDFPRWDEESDDADHYPEEREIRIAKYCWEKGIDPSRQLRYFEAHHPELLREVPEDSRLTVFQDIFIFSR